VASTSRAVTQTAFEFLRGLDDPIAALARDHGPVDFTLPSHGQIPDDHVGKLALSIVGQLISVKAAAVIFRRLSEMLGGYIDPQGLAAADVSDLRGIGLSQAKARAIHELGLAIVTGRFSFAELDAMNDGDAEARLATLRGIGPWSAQMFLLRSMGRPDVFPAGDLGLRRGIELIDALRSMPSIREAAERALVWQPYRSYAAKYLWLHYSSKTTIQQRPRPPVPFADPCRLALAETAHRQALSSPAKNSLSRFGGFGALRSMGPLSSS
jgi:DNA-3-methyladenine glycosylase II